METLYKLTFLCRFAALVLLLTVAALLVAVIARAQQPENLAVEWRYFTTARFTAPAYLATPGPEQSGIWISVFVDDPGVDALSITLNFRDDSGRDLSRTELVTRSYRDRAAWTNHLFIVGKVRVKSVLVVALRAEHSRLVEVE